MKILFVSHVSCAHSVNRVLLNLIDDFTKRGIICHVIIPEHGLIVAELENRGITYSILPMKTWVTLEKRIYRRILRAGFDSLISLIIAIRAYFWKIDIIYTNSSVISGGAFAAFLTRKPHIWHIREFASEHYDARYNFGEPISMRLMEKLSSHVIVISNALKKKYLQYIPETKLTTIYDPVYLSKNYSINANSHPDILISAVPIIGIVASVHAGKGQMDAVLAVADLAKQGIHTKLKIVGSNTSAPEFVNLLKQCIIQNNIVENVEFTGWLNDMVSLYNAIDIALVCSRWEGFGLATVEAMMFKRPVIGARSGSTPELISDGFNGLLYEPGNYQELAQKIKFLIDHQTEARRMGENGFREASKKYTSEKCANEVYRIIMQVMKKINNRY